MREIIGKYDLIITFQHKFKIVYEILNIKISKNNKLATFSIRS